MRPAATLAAGAGLVAAALVATTGTSPGRAAAAAAAVYVFGHLAGGLLVRPVHSQASLALATVRLVSGLFLSSIAFLFSLVVSAPWYTGPALLVGAVAAWRGRDALLVPRLLPAVTGRGLLAALATFVLLSPPLISAARMAPGEFPPVFLNVDIPYFLEKVHTLVTADTYPPGSLSVLGGSRPYHFGLHGAAALITRASGLAPHHAVFGLLVPLLLAGVAAAAVLVHRALSPALTPALAIPLLVVSVPTLWYEFWQDVMPRLSEAWMLGSLDPLNSLTSNWEMWGVTSNVQNLGAHFLVLATLAASLSTGSPGWSLACVLAGSAVLFKSPAGVALMAGFCLAQALRAAAARSVWPLAPAVAATAVFAGVYGTFWVLLPIPPELRATFAPFFQLEYAAGRGGLHWFAYDVVWLVLPALFVVWAPRTRGIGHALPLAAFALGPFLVVNTLRLVDLRRDYGISSMNEDDWRQIMMPIPVLLHALVLAVIGPRWPNLGSLSRRLCAAALALAILPPLLVAGRYALVLMDTPDRGHEYADNRALGAALATIPVAGSVVVTNDLRYPADGFRRDERQMQIPALFGHQAFAVNYFYEAYAFSPERRRLQTLLTADAWSPAIDAAANEHGWTHLVVHRAYPHPEPVPLERLFENETYTVYRF